MGDRGITVLDFGTGKSDTSVVVTGLTRIVAGLTADSTVVTADSTQYSADQLGSVVEAWVQHRGTPDHSADEHVLEPLQVYAGDVVTGVGFTIYGISRSVPDAISGTVTLTGRYAVFWVWV